MQNYLNNYYITEKPTRMDTLQLGVTVVTRNTIQLKGSKSKTQMTSPNNCNNKQKALKREPTTRKKKLSKTNTTSRVISRNKARITYNLSSLQNKVRTRPTNHTSRNKLQHEYA